MKFVLISWVKSSLGYRRWRCIFDVFILSVGGDWFCIDTAKHSGYNQLLLEEASTARLCLASNMGSRVEHLTFLGICSSLYQPCACNLSRDIAQACSSTVINVQKPQLQLSQEPWNVTPWNVASYKYFMVVHSTRVLLTVWGQSMSSTEK